MASNKMVRPPGFEPGTLGLEGRCSIQLSYGRLNYFNPFGVYFDNTGLLSTQQ